MTYFEFVQYFLRINPIKHDINLAGYYYLFYMNNDSFLEEASIFMIESSSFDMPLLIRLPYFNMKFRESYLNGFSVEINGTVGTQDLNALIQTPSPATNARIDNNDGSFVQPAVQTLIYLPSCTIYTPPSEAGEIFQAVMVNDEFAKNNLHLFKNTGL